MISAGAGWPELLDGDASRVTAVPWGTRHCIFESSGGEMPNGYPRRDWTPRVIGFVGDMPIRMRINQEKILYFLYFWKKKGWEGKRGAQQRLQIFTRRPQGRHALLPGYAQIPTLTDVGGQKTRGLCGRMDRAPTERF